MDTNLSILKYTVIVYAAVFTLGIILTLAFRKTNWGRNMRVATISWLVLSILIVSTSYTSLLIFTLLILLMAFLAIREYYGLQKIGNLPMIMIAGLLLGGITYAVITESNQLFYAIPGIAALFFFAAQLFRHSPQNTCRDASLGLSGLIYWGWLMFHFALLRRLEHGFGYVILLYSLLALNDNSAYFVGKLLGENSPKLAPRISPGKTWLGTIGGSIITICSAFLFWYTVPHLTFLQLGGLALIVVVVIPFGDLIESAMKRDIGVKDSGNLIPGHGGAMDRFDSWTFTVPIMYYYILLIS